MRKLLIILLLASCTKAQEPIRIAYDKIEVYTHIESEFITDGKTTHLSKKTIVVEGKSPIVTVICSGWFEGYYKMTKSDSIVKESYFHGRNKKTIK